MRLAHGGHVVPTASVGTAALRWAVLLLAAAAVCWLLTRARPRTALLVGLLSGVAATEASTWLVAGVSVAHRTAAAVWLGATAAAVLRVRSVRLAVGSAVVMVGTGIGLAAVDRVRLDGTSFDRLVQLKALLFLGVLALGLLRRHRVELVALTAAASVGSVLLLVPVAPKPGPLVSAAGGRQVLVVPQRPGVNLVRVDTDEPTTVAGVRTSTWPGATGQWATVTLRPGRQELQVGGRAVLVDTGARRGVVADDAECASALLAGASACPSAALTDADAAALRALRTWLAARGQTRVRVIGDSSPRSLAATTLWHPPGQDPADPALRDLPVLLTGTWASADAALAQLDRRTTAGVYLAPWLLSGDLLTRHATAAPLVVLPFAPAGASRYLATAPVPSYEAWALSRPPRDIKVYATSPASILPASLGHDHPDARRWFPGGALTAVSRTLH